MAERGHTRVPTQFTCITCRLIFEDSNAQREHHKSQLHLFNSKRKIVGLQPVSTEAFEKKLSEVKENMKTENGDQKFRCEGCRKTFHSSTQYNQHIQSKKHKNQVELSKKEPNTLKPEAQITESSAPQLDESGLTEEEVYELRKKNAREYGPKDCLFCVHTSKKVSGNLKHMAREHGLFIPEIDYVSDLEGYLNYLNEKISIGYICLYCNGKGKAFKSLEAVLHHMICLSHCKILYDGNEDEYADFYKYPDEVEMKEDIQETPMGELRLSSTKIIGHKDFRVYYKQTRRANNNLPELRSVMEEYKRIEARKDQMSKVDKQSLRSIQRNYLRLGLSTNNAGMLRFKNDNPI